MNTVSLCLKCAPLLERNLSFEQMLKAMCKECRFRTKIAQAMHETPDEDGFVDLKSKLDKYGKNPIGDS